MTTIYVYENSGSIKDLICSTLCNFRINLVDNHISSATGNGYELLLLGDYVTDIHTENAIILLGGDYYTVKFRPRFDSVIICDASNGLQISALSKLSNNVITCGGDKSIISYTSCTQENVVVSLNRCITALSGRVIEPLEIPIKLQGSANLYDVMAVTALRLLLDDCNSDIGELYK